MINLRQRLVRWAIAVALLLLIPLVLTWQGSGVDGDGWHWTFFDFVFMGTLLFGSALIYELVARKMTNTAYRAAVGVAVVSGLLLVYVNAAVGIIGEDNGTNLMYFGVLAIGFVSALIVRFKPAGMARALFATGTMQFLVPFIALVFWNDSIVQEPPGAIRIVLLNGFFVALWVASAILFRHANASGQKLVN